MNQEVMRYVGEAAVNMEEEEEEEVQKGVSSFFAADPMGEKMNEWFDHKARSDELLKRLRDVYSNPLCTSEYKEMMFAKMLGEIKSINVVGYESYVWLIRATTSCSVYRLVVAMPLEYDGHEWVRLPNDDQGILKNMFAYDPWEDKWIPHVEHLICIDWMRDIKKEDECYAEVSNMFRALIIKEFAEQDKINPNTGMATINKDVCAQTWK